MRKLLLVGFLAAGAFGLAGCYSSETVERPVVIHQPPPAQTTVINPTPGSTTIICPAGATSC